MGAFLEARRREMERSGRPATLSRLNGPSVTLQAFPREFKANELVNGVMVGDLLVHTLDDEIAAASWPAPPAKMDRMTIDGRTHIVQAAWPVHEGSTRIGWRLWTRGG